MVILWAPFRSHKLLKQKTVSLEPSLRQPKKYMKHETTQLLHVILGSNSNEEMKQWKAQASASWDKHPMTTASLHTLCIAMHHFAVLQFLKGYTFGLQVTSGTMSFAQTWSSLGSADLRIGGVSLCISWCPHCKSGVSPFSMPLQSQRVGNEQARNLTF